MKTTKYFLVTQERPDRAVIKREWIEQVITKPEHSFVQQDGRIRMWSKIVAMEGRY